jgi:serine/threonine-protein kinase
MGLLDRFRIQKSLGVLLASDDTVSSEKAQAAARLKQLGAVAVPKLVHALGHTSNPEPIIELLTTLLDNHSLSLFCHALSNQNPQVVAGVVKALERGKKYDPNRLLDLFADPTVAKGGLVTILAAHKEAVQPRALLRLLDITDKGGRAAVFRVVDEIASEAMLPELIPYTQHQDWQIRQQVARILGRFSTAAGRDALLQLLADPHKQVRQVALASLTSLQLPVDVGPVCQLLRDPDLTVQSKAIEAIIQLNDPDAVYYLLEFLQDDSEYVRRAVVEVLNAIGTTSVIKELLGALRDKDWWVRVRAADALGNIGGPRVVDAVLPLLKDEDEFIRRYAVEILNTRKDERSFQVLVDALGDQDWWVRERAVDALTQLGDRRAVPALLQLVEHDSETTLAAIRALVTLGDSQAVQPLLAKLHGPDNAVRKEALRALETLTTETHAAAVQSAITQVIQGTDKELGGLAMGVARSLIAKFGDRTCILPVAPPVSDATPAQPQPAVAHEGMWHATPPLGLSPSSPDVSMLDVPGVRAAGEQLVDASRLEAGVVLAERYRVIRHIGKGAFGIVVLVEDMVVHEGIVLKFLSPHLAADETIIKRFIHELRLARRITHENIIRIYDFLTLGKSYAISMEYFPSHALAVEMPRTVPSLNPRQLAILQGVCSGMSVAHRANIVHRDLKPQNILVNDDGLVKIVDFGLAAAVSQTDSRLTRSGVLMGTPTYMAPEQVSGGTLDPRTDIYSLGVIMYEMFTGRPPYTGPNPMTVLYQHIEGKALLAQQLNPGLPPALDAVIHKAMAVDPDTRFQSVDELRESLEAISLQEVA